MHPSPHGTHQHPIVPAPPDLPDPVAHDCPRCHQRVLAEKVVCRWCGASHHPECWVTGQGCAHYACAGNPRVLPPVRRPCAPAPGRPAPHPDAGHPSVVACVLGAAACLMFGLVAWLVRAPDGDPPPRLAIPGLRRPVRPEPARAGPTSFFVHDLVIEPGLDRVVLRWKSFKPYEPTVLWGERSPTRSAPVTSDEGGYRCEIGDLDPGQSCVASIGGYPGGPAEVRIRTLLPDRPAAYRLSTRSLSLPAGATRFGPSFGPRRSVRTLWSREGRVVPGAALAPGTILLQDSAHLNALSDATGEPLWEYPIRAAWSLTRPIATGALVVAADDAEVVALDQRTGRPVWRLPQPGVRWLGAAGDEVYVYAHRERGSIHRVQATDGRLLAVIRIGALCSSVQLAGDCLVLHADRESRLEALRLSGRGAGPGDGGERLDGPGESTLSVLDRYRGQRRYDRVFAGTDALVLPPVATGSRAILAMNGRVQAMALSDGRYEARLETKAEPTAIVAGDDGALLLATGGAEPRVDLLDASLHALRRWTLPETVVKGAVAGQIAALVTRQSLQLLDLESGQRWGLDGLTDVDRLDVSPAASVVCFRHGTPRPPVPGSVTVLGVE